MVIKVAGGIATVRYNWVPMAKVAQFAEKFELVHG